jgi:hypothetical protein
MHRILSFPSTSKLCVYAILCHPKLNDNCMMMMTHQSISSIDLIESQAADARGCEIEKRLALPRMMVNSWLGVVKGYKTFFRGCTMIAPWMEARCHEVCAWYHNTPV